MSTRTTHRPASLGFFVALLVAAGASGCSSTQTAELPAHPHHKPTAASEHPVRAASNPVDFTGAIGTRAVVANRAPMTAADRALAARARFAEARAVMERAILLREADPAASVLALDAATREVSTNLAMIESMPHPQPSDTARRAANLMQEWYSAGMKIIEPPPEGLLEVPLPFNVRNKAEAVASTLDRLVEEASGSASRRPIASAKERANGGAPTSVPARESAAAATRTQ